MIIFGRSLGTGPASYLSTIRNPFSIILMSAYRSIKDVVKSVVGKWLSLLSVLVIDHFKNLNCIKNARCPVFLIHGKADTFIPWTHSRDLHLSCTQPTYLHIPEKMDHHGFDPSEDFAIPFKIFLGLLKDGLQTGETKQGEFTDRST